MQSTSCDGILNAKDEWYSILRSMLGLQCEGEGSWRSTSMHRIRLSLGSRVLEEGQGEVDGISSLGFWKKAKELP